jgi:hypothetical protein
MKKKNIKNKYREHIHRIPFARLNKKKKSLVIKNLILCLINQETHCNIISHV